MKKDLSLFQRVKWKSAKKAKSCARWEQAKCLESSPSCTTARGPRLSKVTCVTPATVFDLSPVASEPPVAKTVKPVGSGLRALKLFTFHSRVLIRIYMCRDN